MVFLSHDHTSFCDPSAAATALQLDYVFRDPFSNAVSITLLRVSLYAPKATLIRETLFMFIADHPVFVQVVTAQVSEKTIAENTNSGHGSAEILMPQINQGTVLKPPSCERS